MSARPKTPPPSPGPAQVCAGVLDGRSIAVLNTVLRSQGVTDHDRYEVLMAASMFAAAVDRPRRLS